MQTLFRTCVLLIIGLAAIYTAGCSDNVEQEINPVALDTEPDRGEPSEAVATDGKPIAVTDTTFQDVVLNAEMPVVVELRAEW